MKSLRRSVCVVFGAFYCVIYFSAVASAEPYNQQTREKLASILRDFAVKKLQKERIEKSASEDGRFAAVQLTPHELKKKLKVTVPYGTPVLGEDTKMDLQVSVTIPAKFSAELSTDGQQIFNAPPAGTMKAILKAEVQMWPKIQEGKLIWMIKSKAEEFEIKEIKLNDPQQQLFFGPLLKPVVDAAIAQHREQLLKAINGELGKHSTIDSFIPSNPKDD